MAKVIVFASSKGGTGKTTACVLLASELARLGANDGIGVTLIDADENQHSVRWASKDGCPENLVALKATEESIMDVIQEAESRAGFVLVDLEGSRNLTVATAITRADLVIVPCKPSYMDGQEAVKTIQLVKQSGKMVNREIPLNILFTETNGAIVTKNQRALFEEFSQNNVGLLNVTLVKREMYRNIFAYGGTVHGLEAGNARDQQSFTNGLKNIEELGNAVLKKLDAIANQTEERMVSHA